MRSGKSGGRPITWFQATYEQLLRPPGNIHDALMQERFALKGMATNFVWMM